MIASFTLLFTFIVVTMYTSYFGDGINDISILIIPGILVVAALLLVEDDDMVRRYTKTILKMYGHNVFESVDGQEAETMFRNKCSQISLVISDMIMPKVSGIELSKKLHDIMKDIKILFISGYSEDQISNKDLSTKKINYLQKPFSGKELMTKVREVLDK